jgi:hypothetical protein
MKTTDKQNLTAAVLIGAVAFTTAQAKDFCSEELNRRTLISGPEGLCVSQDISYPGVWAEGRLAEGFRFDAAVFGTPLSQPRRRVPDCVCKQMLRSVRIVSHPNQSRRQAMSEKTPTQQVSEWLAALGTSLERRDVAGAAALFGDDSYWRDLVSFTWNITTAEGNAKVHEMIERAVIPAKPSAWQLEGEASEAGGATEGWIRF